MVSLALFAQEVTTDPVTLLDQLPVLVLGVAVAVAFIRKWIIPGPIYREALEREAETRAENAALRTALEDKILPALIKSGHLTENTIEALDTTSAALTKASDVMDRTRAALETWEGG